MIKEMIKRGDPEIYFSGLLPEAETAQIIKETGMGLETIQFSISDNLDRLEESIAGEKALIKRLGNPSLSLHGPFLDLNPMCFDSRVRQVTFDRFSQAYRAAEEMGAKTIVYHSCMIPTVYFETGWAERMAEFWNVFLEGKRGIRVCMENVLDRKAGLFEEVLKRVTHPDFGICLDLGHAHCYGEDPVEDWVDRLSGHIRHVHVHDNRGDRDAHLAVGAGTIPWDRLLARLAGQREDVSWTIECNTADDVYTSYQRITGMVE